MSATAAFEVGSEEAFIVALAERFREVRLARGMALNEFRTFARSRVWWYESGRRLLHVASLARYAHELSVQPSVLLAPVGDPVTVSVFAPFDADAYFDAFAARLREARLAAGLSQFRFGVLVDISQSQVSHLECGRQRVDSPWRLARMCTVLDVPVAAVADFEVIA